jgi:NAD kinase
MLTPICARSLSFRPLVLPWDICVRLGISADSRARRGILALDGLPMIPVRYFLLSLYLTNSLVL